MSQLLAPWFVQILYTHITCVVLSGCLFFMRGCLVMGGVGLANHVAVKRLSYLIDTTLLVAAIALAVIIHQYPFVHAWLTVKVLLLVVYIALGVFALRRGRTPVVRATCFVAALGVFGFIISVAVTMDPRGALLWVS
ncbi:MAG TPA: SirB2 family protein [Oleiagrimonas sp.]|nr:SirB2 family protein [Oleiagrimonas sp.]